MKKEKWYTKHDDSESIDAIADFINKTSKVKTGNSTNMPEADQNPLNQKHQNIWDVMDEFIDENLCNPKFLTLLPSAQKTILKTPTIASTATYFHKRTETENAKMRLDSMTVDTGNVRLHPKLELFRVPADKYKPQTDAISSNLKIPKPMDNGKMIDNPKSKKPHIDTTLESLPNQGSTLNLKIVEIRTATSEEVRAFGWDECMARIKRKTVCSGCEMTVPLVSRPLPTNISKCIGGMVYDDAHQTRKMKGYTGLNGDYWTLGIRGSVRKQLENQKCIKLKLFRKPGMEWKIKN